MKTSIKSRAENRTDGTVHKVKGTVREIAVKIRKKIEIVRNVFGK